MLDFYFMFFAVLDIQVPISALSFSLSLSFFSFFLSFFLAHFLPFFPFVVLKKKKKMQMAIFFSTMTTAQLYDIKCAK